MSSLCTKYTGTDTHTHPFSERGCLLLVLQDSSHMPVLLQSEALSTTPKAVPPSSYSSARLKPVISAPASPSQSNNPALGLSQSPKIIPAKTQAMFDLPEPVDLSGDLPSVTDMQPHLEPPEDFEEKSIQSHPFEEESIQSHQKDGLALATDNWSGDEDEFLDDFIENDEEALYGEKTTISLESAFYEGEDEEDNDAGSGKTPSESSDETKGFLGLFKKPKIIPASEKSKR